MKTSEIEAYLNKISMEFFGRLRSNSECVSCGGKNVEPKDFRNDLARREFEISKMCQSCQDSI